MACQGESGNNFFMKTKIQSKQLGLPDEALAESGQSLIETIIAIFVLTTALTTGLGLVIYAFTNSSISQNEIVAVNLAREGIEVVHMMRDSNWLAGEASADPSYNLQTCADLPTSSRQQCYPRTNSGPNYSLSAGNQRIMFDPIFNTWSLNATADYDLYVQPDGSYRHVSTAFSPIFARMIYISFNSSAPYTNQNSNQEMIIKSVVAWRNKNCPTFAANQDLLALSSNCKIVVEEHLTNWKNY